MFCKNVKRFILYIFYSITTVFYHKVMNKLFP